MNLYLPSPTQEINLPLIKEKEIRLFIKRDDLIHEVVSGNKWRKLKFNIDFALKNNYSTVLTFGGAYSNHIVATAFACKENGLNSIGVIRDPSVLLASPKHFAKASRTSPLDPSVNFQLTSPLKGENTQHTLNHTLRKCIELGMQLHFISREEYKRKTENDFIEELKNKFGDFYLIPEGGANELGVKGCQEILLEESVVELNRNHRFNYICCAAGTGTTLAGLFLSLRENEKLIGFPALKIPSDKSSEIKGGFILDEIKSRVGENYFKKNKNRIELNCDYHFGGYAKVNDELKIFVSDFFDQTNIQLDLIYNGKMMFGLFDLIQNDHFPKGSQILAIHTGGVQGNQGFL